ncbi:MAG: hypothetical protein COA39_007960 [Sulfurimonas sp.]|nr:hypothetical protein [Sulfurimonas sp.]
MKTFLVGLAITVIGGLILSYIQDINIIILLTNTTSWIYSLLIKVLNFCISVLTFGVPIWFIIGAIFLISIVYKFKINYQKASKTSLSKQYDELTDNEKNIFNIILVHNEQRRKCTYDDILQSTKQQQLNISNLETQQVLESLIIKSFIYLQEEWMDKSHYILSSSKGRDLAVLLIQTMGNK